MINYLQIEQLSKSFGDNILFEDVSFSIAQGDKVGLIARNGKGKSTLLSIIAGEEDYDAGKITFRRDLKVGYLNQTPKFNPGKSLLDNMDSPDEESRERAKKMLSKLKLDWRRTDMTGMSGGECKRAAIARTLSLEPDMLILDEPTNHLDIDMIEWLENYLATQKTTLLMVTHDRYFLDNVCSRILEIDMQRLYNYDGNYDYYLEKRTERRENMALEKSKVDNLLRKEREWMRRQPQARGSKAKYRIDNFHELERRSRVNLAEKDVRLSGTGSYIGSKIFEARNVSKKFGDKIILTDWSYDFARGEKVGIVGNNGMGKSTMLKLILGELQPDSGHIDLGQTLRFGYYSQNGYVDFDENKRVIDAVSEIAEHVRIDDKTVIPASSFLTRFLFSPTDQRKYIYKLSGGERRRLYLATILMKNPNFLILDEPTNDLDLQTLAVLEDYLEGFKGCVLTVSHDRFFLDRVTDHMFVLEGDGKVRDFPGDYSTYRHCMQEREKELRAETRKQSRSENPAKQHKQRTSSRAKLSFKQQREREEIEKRLPLLEKEKRELEIEMSSGKMNTQDIIAAGERMSQLIGQIDSDEMRLLELMEIEEG